MALLRDHFDGCTPLREGSNTIIPLVMGAIDRNTPPDVTWKLAHRRFDHLDFRHLQADRTNCGQLLDFSVENLIRSQSGTR